MKKIIIVILIITSIYSSIFFIQKSVTSQRKDSWLKERLSYLPQTDRIKPFLLGFSSTYANYLWIKTMIYFGTHYASDNTYTWLTAMVNIITKLNPYFYPAYEFAGTVLPSLANNPDAARIILHRGITNLGNTKFSIPFYLGWLYYDKYQDYESAAYFLAYAGKNLKAPAYISRLAATLYKKTNQTEVALQLLYAAYEATENPSAKKTLKEKIISIQDSSSQNK